MFNWFFFDYFTSTRASSLVSYFHYFHFIRVLLRRSRGLKIIGSWLWYRNKFEKLTFQLVIFKPLSYCFKETLGFDVKVSFASRPVLHLIRVTVCNFQSMKTSVELNSFSQNSFVISPGLLYHLIRRHSGRLSNEAFTSNPIVSLTQ